MISSRRSYFLTTMLLFGYAFLYVPIFLLIITSFNASFVPTFWGGWSLRWYDELIHNEELLSAAWLSLRIAMTTATISALLGTLAGFCLARLGQFKGRTFLTGMVSSPLVMPEIITGLSLLLFFVSLSQLIGWPETRGFNTITIAHITFTMAYVTVIVQSRLMNLEPQLEEAAMDLGARPLKIFMVITLPLIAPAIATGWLLAFTLSLDDVVVASFVSGPGSTTLPMMIFSSMRVGLNPQINALASIIISLASLLIMIYAFVKVKNNQKEQGKVRKHEKP